MSGKYKEPSAAIQKGIQLWVQETNEKGGVLGREVKLIVYDDKSDAELAKSLYEKLINQDKVDLLLSPYSTPLTLSASKVSEQHKMVMLAIAAAAKSPWEKRAWF